MSSIFISYARENRPMAQDLAWELEQRGADVWWDNSLLSGERYIEAILRQIQRADHVLLLLSEDSAKSQFVAFEIGATRARELAIERDVLKVAHLDECDVPGFIGERQATPLRDGIGSEEFFDIVRALGLPRTSDYKPPAGPNERSLKVFKAGSQWMELIKSFFGLTCVLVDPGEERARIQWVLDPDALERAEVRVRPADDNDTWSLFQVGDGWQWRWSPVLFASREGPPPHEALEAALRELIEWDPAGN